MQKILRRAATADYQAASRLARRKDKFERENRKSQRENERFAQRTLARDIKEERQARREDWEQGPLAPKRDVGFKKDTYGTIDAMRLQGRQLTIAERLEVNPVGGRYANIVVGDRVVLLAGKDKGKIGKITAVDRRRQECTIDGLNMVDVELPKWAVQLEQDPRPYRSMPKPLSLTEVKLVFPLPDPTTGTVRDVIVKKLINGKIWHDRFTGRKRWTRFIPGLNVVVPWPKVPPQERKDFACDTLRIDVEAKTFVPSLLKPPMPINVIDELRNKYSKFRTRHDEEYITRKTAEEKEAEARKNMATIMKTPLKEANRRERQLKKTKRKGELTKEMLIRIGQVIARKKQLALEDSGLEKVEAAA